jgi:hypothetical protein
VQAPSARTAAPQTSRNTAERASFFMSVLDKGGDGFRGMFDWALGSYIVRTGSLKELARCSLSA